MEAGASGGSSGRASQTVPRWERGRFRAGGGQQSKELSYKVRLNLIKM